MKDLTARQRQVAVCVARGMGYKDIGRTLGMSWYTARAHVVTIANRLPDDDSPPLRRVMAWMLDERTNGTAA